ncbi:hypothetical protein SDC9_193910 [bioreactor metagenome]|uniref:Uncharacterized protein n=1 Tax=bioreactor metagenome TaxID=1076179 RepID=A0A645IDF7_9ZZZZ
MKLFSVGCFVEIKIASEYLVGAFTGKHHLHAHGFNIPGNQVHRRTGTHRGYVVGLDMVDDITDGIEAFLYSILYLVVDGADVFGHFPGSSQIG